MSDVMSFSKGKSLLFILTLLPFTRGDFGDTADLSFQCPAYTTCPVVCVADEDQCPTQCSEGATLCSNGSCATEGKACADDLESPCTAECAPIACAKADDYLPKCYEQFGDLYYAATACAEEETAVEVSMFTFKEPGFVFYYCWMSMITALIIGWCAFNQRIAPVEGSTMSLKEAVDSGYEGVWTQTAYRTSLVGSSIFVLTCLTFIGYQVLFVVLTVLYYVQQEAITFWKPVFQDEEQILLAFIIAWMVGIVWHFALKWPYSIRSLFLRRCLFEDATHVAVFAPTKSVDDASTFWTEKAASFAKYFADLIMGTIFSDVTRPKEHGQLVYCPVHNENGNRFFYFRLRRYNFDSNQGFFHPGRCIAGTSIGEMDQQRKGLEAIEVEKKMFAIGPNYIHIKKPNILKTILHEFSGPFYLYQCFIIWTWFPLWYYYMAIVWTIIVLSGGLSVVFFKYKNEVSLYKLTHVSGSVYVLRDGKYDIIDQKDLVPGDVVMLKPGLVFADMVVLRCSNVVVDESALTGESYPVSKTAIDVLEKETAYNPKTHKRQTISAGTTILENSGTEGDIGLVISTGSFTSKGEMLRDILAFERHRFKFDSEVLIVVFILFVVGVIGFILTAFVLIKERWIYGWFYGIFVFASALPALLPTVFVVSVGISDERLSKKRIACVNSESILIAGKVRMALFDKTGTLTKQGLDFASARSADNWERTGGDELPLNKGRLATGMACCHTLVETCVGVLIGNEVDKIMFEASGATMMREANPKSTVYQYYESVSSDDVEHLSANAVTITEADGNIVTVLKRFDFDHNRMTQTVIVRVQDGTVMAFVKGSAESIKQVCRPDSFPLDFECTVKCSASEGIYQISMASKMMNEDDIDMHRDEIETDLTFIGVINFKNVLREETRSVLQELEMGDIRCAMVTGDSVLTGVHIAKESGMIKPDREVFIGVDFDSRSSDIAWVNEAGQPVLLPKCLELELVISGHAWKALLEKNRARATELVESIRVFGRCTPNDKISVVSALSEKGYMTLMCGDGGNDCGALKTAHVGIALSDAEASIVSPFTSLDKCITSVPRVLKEGRCALASAFASYKYMIMYGQVEMINQMANAYFQVTFAENCWIFMDGVWLIFMAFTLPLARAANTLAPERPTASILGPHTLSSALGVLALNLIFMVIGLAALFHQDWFQCRKWSSNDVSNVQVIGDNYEAQVLFLVTGYQYISSAMAFNFGYNFRAAWIRNYWFVAFAFLFTFTHFYSTMIPSPMSCFFRVNCLNEDVVGSLTDMTGRMPIQNPYNHTLLPYDFRIILCVIMVMNTVATSGYEFFIVNGIGKKLAKQWKNRGHATMQENINYDFVANPALEQV